MTTLRHLLPALIVTMVIASGPLYAEEDGKVSAAVNCYYFNPAQQNSIQPLYIGDAVPSDGVLYLQDANSRLTFARNGKTVALKTPGFYNTSGAPAHISEATQALIKQLVKMQAENLIHEVESESPVALQIDDKQAIPSPST